MKTFIGSILLMVPALAPLWAQAHESDDPVLYGLKVEQLEWRDDDTAATEGQLWAGRDLRKFWLKFDVEEADGHVEEAELQALYGIAIAPYWDLQLGVRQDVRPQPSKTWAAFALQGLAPYFFETDLALFISDGGDVGARLEAEYELLLTQRLILTPDLSLDIYGQNDPITGLGSGLSKAEAGLRLRYEFRPEFAPYLGVQWSKKFGNSADYARAAGEETEDTALVAGLRFWF